MTKSLVVAFAFGTPSTIPANEAIRAMATNLAIKLNCPIYTQLDVGIGGIGNVLFVKEEPGAPPPTLRIVREVARWAKGHGVETIHIIAASPHLWRCERDMREAVAEIGAVVDIQISPEICEYNIRTWLCPESTQPRTRSWWNWWSRESILKLIPFMTYKLVAS